MWFLSTLPSEFELVVSYDNANGLPPVSDSSSSASSLSEGAFDAPAKEDCEPTSTTSSFRSADSMPDEIDVVGEPP